MGACQRSRQKARGNEGKSSKLCFLTHFSHLTRNVWKEENEILIL